MIRGALAATAVLVGLTTAGCGGGASGDNARTVPLAVTKAPGGAVLALVPVYLKGRGPFKFALDTGASKSVVDRELAQRLQLPVLGVTGPISGVTATTRALRIGVGSWRAGRVRLQPTSAISVDLPDRGGRQGLRGLLGSDVLSRYGSVKVDYRRERLVLEPRR